MVKISIAINYTSFNTAYFLYYFLQVPGGTLIYYNPTVVR